MTIEQRLKRLFDVLLDAVKNDAELRKRVDEALGLIEKEPVPRATKKKGRSPAPFDPYEIYASGEDSLRSKLTGLDIDPLKDIVSQYAMDHTGTVMRLKTKSKVIDHILAIVRSRAQHGDAFRN
jgi:hypothetical protein